MSAEEEIVVVEPPAISNDPAEALDEWKDRFNGLVLTMKSLQTDLKHVAKMVAKSKRRAKRPASSDDKPVGFKVPKRISPELEKFLGEAPGVELPRTVITQRIWAYIRTHNLKSEENPRVLDLSKPGGEALDKLLKPTEPLSLSNMQKFLKGHITTNTDTTIETTVTETPVQKKPPVATKVSVKKR